MTHVGVLEVAQRGDLTCLGPKAWRIPTVLVAQQTNGNGNCWASASATINLYFKHVTRSQDTFKMTSLTQTRKIHVPVGPWIFMVSIVRTAGNCEVWVLAAMTRSYTIEGHNFALSIQIKIFALRTMKRMYVLSTALLIKSTYTPWGRGSSFSTLSFGA